MAVIVVRRASTLSSLMPDGLFVATVDSWNKTWGCCVRTANRTSMSHSGHVLSLPIGKVIGQQATGMSLPA
jgi:hypothetical protein